MLNYSSAKIQMRLILIKYWKPLFFAFYGILAASIIVRSFNFIDPALLQEDRIKSIYMSSRLITLQDSIDAFQAGEPVISRLDVSMGIQMIFPIVGRLFGENTPIQIFLLMQMLYAMIAISVFPSLFYTATKSFAAGLASPFLLHYCLSRYLYVYKTDSCYANIWIVAVGAPILWILFQSKWTKSSYVLFFCLCLAIMAGNIPRYHASMPVLATTAVMLLIKTMQQIKAMPPHESSNWRKCLKTIGMPVIMLVTAAFFYVIPLSVIPGIYNWINGLPKLNNGGQMWFTIYAGLGWENNPYGFMWDDAYVNNAARAIDAVVPFGTREYHAILRRLWIDLLVKDPIYFLQTYSRKFITILYNTFEVPLKTPIAIGRIVTGWLLYFGAALFFRKYIYGAYEANKEVAKKYLGGLAATVICFPFSLAESMMARTGGRYIFAPIAVKGMLYALCICMTLEIAIYYIKKRWRPAL